MANIGQDISMAVDLLKAGKLVAIPTETVYGLAGNALDADVVLNIFEVKKRPQFNPVIVHIYSEKQLEKLVTEIPQKAKRLIAQLWPGPLTLLLPRNPQVIPDVVTAGSPLVAVRMPRHPLSLELLSQLDFPLAAPSANPFGYISPTQPDHVAQQLGDQIDYILDGGRTDVGVESTIVKSLTDTEPATVMRVGGVSIEMLEMLIGPVNIHTRSSDEEQIEASGMMRSHYSPQTPLYVGDIPTLLKEHDPQNCGTLSYKSFYAAVPEQQQRILSKQSDIHEAARNLFSAMRELDTMGLSAILAEVFPDKGLGRAINDRLQRASQSLSQ